MFLFQDIKAIQGLATHLENCLRSVSDNEQKFDEGADEGLNKRLATCSNQQLFMVMGQFFAKGQKYLSLETTSPRYTVVAKILAQKFSECSSAELGKIINCSEEKQLPLLAFMQVFGDKKQFAQVKFSLSKLSDDESVTSPRLCAVLVQGRLALAWRKLLDCQVSSVDELKTCLEDLSSRAEDIVRTGSALSSVLKNLDAYITFMASKQGIDESEVRNQLVNARTFAILKSMRRDAKILKSPEYNSARSELDLREKIVQAELESVFVPEIIVDTLTLIRVLKQNELTEQASSLEELLTQFLVTGVLNHLPHPAVQTKVLAALTLLAKAEADAGLNMGSWQDSYLTLLGFARTTKATDDQIRKAMTVVLEPNNKKRHIGQNQL